MPVTDCPDLAVARWLAPAHAPEWMPWSKAGPADAFSESAHPVLRHILDVACVAEAMLQDRIPTATRRRFETALALDEATTTGALALLVGLHVVEKLTPAFQAKVPDIARELAGRGFDFPVLSSARDHGTAGVIERRTR